MTAGPVFPSSGPAGPGDDWWEEAAAAREWEPPDDDEEELAASDGNPLAGVPAELAGWREELTAGELAEWYAELDALPMCADPEAAWFAAGGPDHAAGDPAGVSVFSAEEAGESLGPGAVLAGLSEQAFGHGLGSLPDDALVGLVRVSRRLAAWQDGVEMAAVAELDARRMAAAARPGSSRASEHVAEELALALVLTGRSADVLLGLAREMVRLPMVVAGLLDGSIDRARAEVFAEELSALDAAPARTVADAFADRAGSLKTAQLRRGLRAMVLLIDPDAARRRARKARGEARVESWQELSGNGALAGRELSAADMLAADARITAIAKALRSAGAAGSLDQVRAAVFCALLAGRDPDTLVPAFEPGDQDAPGPAASGGTGPVPGPGDAGAAGAVDAGSAVGDHDAADGTQARPGPGLGLGALAGSVHLTLPAATWLGWADLPGELPGYGPVDAWTARDLADRLAAGPATGWHVTLTGKDGRAVAHACARSGPPGQAARAGPQGGTGPPGSTRPAGRAGQRGGAGLPGGAGQWGGAGLAGDGSASRAWPVAGWLAGLRFAWLETAPCAHRRATVSYRPGVLLRELVTVRHRTCAFPGCGRPARRCDADHTRPWDDGGPTCECNLAPALQDAPSRQARTGLARRPARPRGPDLDHAPRPYLHQRPRPLPGLTGSRDRGFRRSRAAAAGPPCPVPAAAEWMVTEADLVVDTTTLPAAAATEKIAAALPAPAPAAG